ncbi:hypothetical protein Sm713_17710 [Streptomyces sp. TS71-3]|nr:hypothetical protein Sm713_17710 [Streptomyces sp. TS71-3]
MENDSSLCFAHRAARRRSSGRAAARERTGAAWGARGRAALSDPDPDITCGASGTRFGVGDGADAVARPERLGTPGDGERP